MTSFNSISILQRETEQGKLNCLPLYIIQSQGEVTEEEAKTGIRRIIECNKREML